MAKKKKLKKQSQPTTTKPKSSANKPTPQIPKKKAKRILKIPSFSFKQEAVVLGIIAALCLGLYIKCLPYEYVLDDKIVITDNDFTKSGFQGIWKILTTDSFQGYFGEQKDLVMGARYRPLSIVTFAVEHQIFGLNKEVSHLINILLYLLCCCLVYRILQFMTPETETLKAKLTSSAFIITILFLLHPLHVEAVANIKGRDEIMAMIGSLGALLYAFKFQDNKKYLSLIMMGLCFYFGLFSKETTLTFLAVIPIALYIRSGQLDKTLWLPTASLFILTAIYLMIRINIIGYLYDPTTNVNDLMNNPFVEMNISEKWATIVYTTGLYIKLCFFPHPLTHDYYPYHIPIMQWADPKVILSLLALAGMILGSFWGLIKRSWVGFGVMFFLLTLSIVSNVFVNVGTFMNERFAFIPSLGILIFLVLGLQQLSQRFKINKLFTYSLFGLMAIGFLFKTWTRIPAWKDTYSLNSAAIKVSKNSARLNSFMSTAIYNKTKEMPNRKEKMAELKQGLAYAKKAVEIYPTYNNGYLMISGLSAEIYKIDNELDKFLVDLKLAASVRPDIPFITEYCQYLNGRSNIDIQALINFYYELGYQELFNRRRNAQWAIHYLKLGRSLQPSNKKINLALADAYAAIGDNRNAQIHREYGTN